MKSIYTVTIIIAILILSACQSPDSVEPIKEETTPFNISSAIEMVEKKEKMITDFMIREKISRTEYEEAEKTFAGEFGDRARDILSMLLIQSADSEPPSEIAVSHNMLYPTIFHEGISVTSAVVYKSYYENEFFNEVRLIIKEEYTGDDEKLKDWSREYIFVPNESGGWELKGFSGVMNFSGEDF